MDTVEEWYIPRKLQVSEPSTSGSLGDVSWVQKATLQLYRRKYATPPHVHPTSRYVIVFDQFYQKCLQVFFYIRIIASAADTCRNIPQQTSGVSKYT